MNKKKSTKLQRDKGWKELKNTEVCRLRPENKELNEHYSDVSIDLEIVKLTNNDIRKAIEIKEKELQKH